MAADKVEKRRFTAFGLATRFLFGFFILFAGDLHASIAPLPFDANHNTWNATHIVVVEKGKVIESWKGDLRVGDALPEGAKPFAAMVPPKFSKREAALQDLKDIIPARLRERMVLFLAYVPKDGDEPGNPSWTAAEAPGLPRSENLLATVAWLYRDRVFSVEGVHNEGVYELVCSGTVARLKQQVDLGLFLRGQFDNAVKEKDLKGRAERLHVLSVFVKQYAGSWGRKECVQKMAECQDAGIRYLLQWILDPKADFAADSLFALRGLGDAGLEAMIKALDHEVMYWKGIADDLGPMEWVDKRVHTDIQNAWRGPQRLQAVLYSIQQMKLTEAGRSKLIKTGRLQELRKIMEANPYMRPEETDMGKSFELLGAMLGIKPSSKE